MNQITVRLNNHKIQNGEVVAFRMSRPTFLGTTEDDYNNPKMWTEETGEWVPTEIRVGAQYVVGSIEDVSPNALRDRTGKTRYFLSDGPISGNSDRNITRYHGWRGTTNDQSVCAHGLRRIVKIRELRSGMVAVTLGRDLAPEEK